MDRELSAALKKLFETKLHGAMRMYLDTCARCGNCVTACHVYASMPDVRYSAVGRAETVRKIFKRYFKLQGKLAPWLGETLSFDDDTLRKLEEAAFTCTGCRRCVMACPFAIDTQQIMGIAKALLIGADKEPKILSMLADMSIAKGDSSDETRAAFVEAARNLDPEVEAIWPKPEGRDAIPVDRVGARVLYVALSGKHSIVPSAAVMNAAGEDWTLSRFEAVNFGAFLGDAARQKAIAKRIVDEANRLGVREVAVVECGTAFRVLKWMIGKQRFSVVSIAELIARYIREGRVKLDKSKLTDKITYHDPCQLARNSGVIEEPREILRALTDSFVEMTPNREDNWCCGGGGGLVAAGDKDFRMKSAKVKADQVRATGAAIVCTACENCHSQLSDLNEHYGLGMRVEFLSKLVADALVKP